MKKSQRNIENVDVISHNHTKSLHKSALLTKQDAFYVRRSPYTMYGDLFTNHYLFSEKALLLNDDRPADANHKYNDHQQIREHLTRTNDGTC